MELLQNELDDYLASGDTPLHRAALLGVVHECKTLIAAGADLEARDRHGMTPLHCAGKWGEALTSKVLFGAGADVNAVSGHGMTPLHLAAWWGNVSVCEVLIKAGADFGAMDARGRTPIELARDDSVKDVIRAAISKVEMKALEKSTGETAKQKRAQKPASVQSMSI